MSPDNSVLENIVIGAILLIAIITLVSGVLLGGVYSPPSIETVGKLTENVINEYPTEIVSYYYVHMRGGGYWAMTIVATDGELYNVDCDWRFCYHIDKVK